MGPVLKVRLQSQIVMNYKRNEIYLGRHAESAMQIDGRMDSHRWNSAMKEYDERGVSESATMSPQMVQAAREVGLIVHGPLPRSSETVERLKQLLGECPPRTEKWPEITEAALPQIRVPVIKLPMNGWTVIARLFWILGFTSEESLSEARRRAQEIVIHLESVPQRSVLVIGHGFLNVLIVQSLRKSGWSGSRLPNLRHADISKYH